MAENKGPIGHKSIKKVDALITGLILGGVVASIYGIKKTEEIREHIRDEKASGNPDGKLGFWAIAAMLIKGVPKEKPTMWQKIRNFLRK